MEAVLDFNHSRGKIHLIFAWNYVVRKVGFLVPEFFWREIDENGTEFSVSQNSKKMNSLRCSRLSEVRL